MRNILQNTASLIPSKSFSLKVHQCKLGNTEILSSYENNMLKISLKHLLLFEICAREICEKFDYEHSAKIEYVKN